MSNLPTTVHSTMTTTAIRTVAVLIVCAALLPRGVAADDDLDSLEQKALAAAAQHVGPSVVRIETIGGLERVQGLLFGTGPTTGLVMDPQGYIVSSAFNFVNKPASILVRLEDGTRKPARLVATDHSRRIVLLKIETERPLPAPQIAPEKEMRVGQWCVAVGRTFESDRPNMAVGILSALGRVWGKAIQTDAAVSPNNYGGPLVDLRGRVLGVLVPLSPQSAEEVAGYEWYDSGIGFAVPAEHIAKILPRLKEGKDLYAGVAGVNLDVRDLYTGDSTIAACRPLSPAAKAGFQKGDRIVEIAGRKIARSAEVKQEIGRHYAGDTIRVAVLRGEKRIEADVQLVANLVPYQHAFLGVLPQRTTSDKAGVTVRWVYPQSPAAGAGIESGDVLLSLAGKPIKGRGDLLRQIEGFETGQDADLEFRHGEQVKRVKLKLGKLPESLPPASLPSARVQTKPGAQSVRTGVFPLKVNELKNEAWAYVPEGYDAAVPHGLIVCLQGPEKVEPKDLVARWKPLCDRHDLIFVAAHPAEPGRWKPDEVEFVVKLIQQVQSGYHVDPPRIVVQGREGGGGLAYLAAFRNRELLRAVAAIDGMPPGQPPESEPVHRLAVFAAASKKSPQAPMLKAAIGLMRGQKVPVTEKDLGDAPREFSADELAELVRWIDMLDRI